MLAVLGWLCWAGLAGVYPHFKCQEGGEAAYILPGLRLQPILQTGRCRCGVRGLGAGLLGIVITTLYLQSTLPTHPHTSLRAPHQPSRGLALVKQQHSEQILEFGVRAESAGCWVLGDSGAGGHFICSSISPDLATSRTLLEDSQQTPGPCRSAGLGWAGTG